MATPELVDEDLQFRTCELLRGATALRGHSFMTILEVGVDDGLAYYVTHLNDGEFVQQYVQRRGAVPTVTALALVHQLLQDLGRAEEQGQLPSTVSLERVLVSSQEEEYLQLRLFDYGLSQPKSEAFGQHSSRLVREACCLLFLLMTGQSYSGGNPDDSVVIAELPANLRFLIKSALTSPAVDSISRKALRDEVREAMCSYVTLVQARNPKMLLVAEPSTLPVSHLQTLLLGDIPLETLFGTSFRIQNPELSGCHPFAISAVNASAEMPVTLHLLPPERIIRQSGFTTFPPQVWRQDPAKQANILHLMSLWNGPDWAFLSEAREPGMALSALMAKRGTLNPGEVVTLLRQIHAGVEQAAETGMQRVDLDPANIQLCVGYDGPVLPRDLERLHQKRLDAWPKFVVKLRLHKTMRSLCKPRLIDLSPWGRLPHEETTGSAAREECNRSFICLAIYLITGVGQMSQITGVPTSMPELAAGYLHECLQQVLCGAPVPCPPEFTEKLSYLLTAASAEMDSIEDPLASQEMESAGFISDFEEDRAPEEPSMELARKTLLLAPVSADLQSLDLHRSAPPRFAFPWLALAATAALLGALAWMIFGEMPEAPSPVLTEAPKSSKHEAALLPKEIAGTTPDTAVNRPAQPLPQPIIHKTPARVVEPLAQPSQPLLVAEVTAPALQKDALSSSMPAAPETADFTPALSAPSPSTEKMAEPRLPEPPLILAEKTAASMPAPEPEPVIRRAILATPEVAQSSPLPPKEVATLPAPPQTQPAQAEPPAPQPAVASIATPPAHVAKLEAVTIRHAIVMTPEEINEALRAQAKARKRSSKRR
ncbi:MAG: hypothetical protein J0L73_07725 [Verrucomicrobia bacterium]|nr:hypothetical protein [Verrucomicrobiota bacterium]